MTSPVFYRQGTGVESLETCSRNSGLLDFRAPPPHSTLLLGGGDKGAYAFLLSAFFT